MKSDLRSISHCVSGEPAKGTQDPTNFEETVEQVLLHCLHAVQAQSGSLFLRLKKDMRLKLVKAMGTRENYHCGKVISIGEGVSGFVAEKKEAILVADLAQDASFISRQEKSLDSFMSCPVMNGASVLAVINVSGRKNGRAFSGKDLKKLQATVEAWKAQLKQAANRHSSVSSNRVEDWPSLLSSSEKIDEALDQLRKYSSIVLRSLSRYVLVFDRRFRIVYCSNKSDFGRLFAGTNSRRLKQNILDLPFEVEREELKAKLEGLLLKGSPFSLGNVRIKDASDIRIVNMFFSPFLSVQGNLLGGLLLIDDNTKIHEMQQRLFEAEKFSFIGSLLSMITHEVNIPLDGVNRLVSLSLSKVTDDGSVREYLLEAQKGLQRICSLVNSLLGFSRRTSSFEKDSLPLTRVLDEAVAAVHRRNEGKNILLHLDYASENPAINANDFYQIATNILGNAFDAVSPDRGNITIETDIKKQKLHLIVRDDGCGIPKKLLPSLFEPFVTSKELGRGTGLGLAIVKKLTEKYQGTILVESEEMRGTTFHLIFPLHNVMIQQ
jgi:signal transduction histidine kinase